MGFTRQLPGRFTYGLLLLEQNCFRLVRSKRPWGGKVATALSPSLHPFPSTISTTCPRMVVPCTTKSRMRLKANKPRLFTIRYTSKILPSTSTYLSTYRLKFVLLSTHTFTLPTYSLYNMKTLQNKKVFMRIYIYNLSYMYICFICLYIYICKPFKWNRKNCSPAKQGKIIYNRVDQVINCNNNYNNNIFNVVPYSNVQKLHLYIVYKYYIYR